MDVVYYPSIVPNNRYTITQLAILFDRILLPGTYLPLGELDPAAIKDCIETIERADARRNEHSRDLLLPLRFAQDYQELSGVFVGTGEWGHMGQLEPGANKATLEIEELYYGKPAEGFIPAPNMGFNIGVGEHPLQVNGPSEFSYPANAYIYSSNNNLPLVSDSTMMPLPSHIPHKANAELLAAHLSLAALALILPRIKPLSAPEIMEVREKMRDDIQSLNTTLLSYAGKLRDRMGEDSSLEDLQQEAEFIAKTEVYPQVEYLRRTIETPGRIVKRNALDFTLENPELITSMMLQPQNLDVWLKVLKATGKQVKTVVDEIRDGAERERASGLGLLLKLPKKYRKN